MSAATIATSAVDQRGDQEKQPVTQYSRAQILGLWAAAAGPMAILAWVVAPWLSHHLDGPEPLGQALLIVLNAGLVWILALTLIVIRREQGSLKWSRVRDALWLRPPQDPKSRRVGGKLWWWLVPFVVLSMAINLVPTASGPLPRDFPNFITTDRAEHFYSGAWGWFALTVLVVAFLSPSVEELFFRGLLLPRMRAAFGRGDWLANGAAFALYHLHQPWSMPGSLLDGTFAQAYPAKRFRSIWISIVTHTAPSFVMIGVVLPLVLK